MIKLLNGEEWVETDIIERMYDDDFYYGHLGKNALSSSALKKLLESPKSYAKSLDKTEETQPLRDGRLIHMLTLEPEKAEALHIVNCTKRANEYKEAVESYGHHNVFTASEFNYAKDIADALRNNDDAAELLKGMSFEVPFIGTIQDLPFRVKADCISEDGALIVDLKTTADVYSWERSARRYKYALQAELYRTIFGAKDFIFLVIDKNTTDIGIFDCTEEFYAEGGYDIECAIQIYKDFFLNGNTEELIRNYVIRGLL